MSKFKESQYERQIPLMNTDVFSGDSGNGYFMGKSRAFVLKNGMNNLYEPIRQDVLKYFADNGIAWWRGSKPTGHTLSSQMACLNHLFAIRHDRDAVLAILNGIRDATTREVRNVLKKKNKIANVIIIPIKADKSN